MAEINGSSTKKQVLFSIGSYREEKKKINKITAAELFSSSNSVPPSPTSPTNYQPIRLKLKERPASLNITDEPLFNNLQHQPSRKLTFQNGKVFSPTWKQDEIEKPTCPPTLHNDNKCYFKAQRDGLLDKPTHPPQMYQRSVSLEPEQLRHSGKVALTIAAYEGDPKTPTRMEFLPPQTLVSRSSSKASDITALSEDSTDNINSRLQNELVATLKRSNLKKRHDTLENGIINETNMDQSNDDELKDDEKEIVEKDKSNGDLANGNSNNVKKLATVLTKTLTFRLNPEE